MIKTKIERVFTSPFRGEDAFQHEQKSASVRKAGEGEISQRKSSHPHPIFQTLILRVEKSPLP